MKKRMIVLAAVLAMICAVTACGSKKDENGTESPQKAEEKEQEAANEFTFLELIGKDCQLLPNDVEATVSDYYVVAVGKEPAAIGGVEGTVTYKYKVEDPFITEITWSITDAQMDDVNKVAEAMTDRYGTPDMTDELQVEDGMGDAILYTWKEGDGCRIRASITNTPINGSNATISWTEKKEDDWSFLNYLGESTDALPADKMIDMSEGTDGLLIMMDEMPVYGESGSASFYFNTDEKIIRAVSWESLEMTEEGTEAMLWAARAQYGEESDSGSTDEEGHKTYLWTNADGYALEMTVQNFDGTCFVNMKWQ